MMAFKDGLLAAGGRVPDADGASWLLLARTRPCGENANVIADELIVYAPRKEIYDTMLELPNGLPRVAREAVLSGRET